MLSIESIGTACSTFSNPVPSASAAPTTPRMLPERPVRSHESSYSAVVAVGPDELTDLVEEAVLQEFERLSDRGGVLGAMERMYQRTKIQEESLHYERQKHTGELPIIGVNTYLDPQGSPTVLPREVIRSRDDEKEFEVDYVRADGAPGDSDTYPRVNVIARREGTFKGPCIDKQALFRSNLASEFR